MSQDINLYLSQPHECSYLKAKEANSVFVDPALSTIGSLYSQLIQHGFRRSGKYVYRPHCEDCQSCISIRLDVNAFTPNRSQKRTLKYNQDLHISYYSSDQTPTEEQYQLYQEYLTTRHRNGGMDENISPEKYQEFLTSPWSDTEFIEFRFQDRLLAVACTDILDNGLSAVYTYFSPKPEYKKRALGVNAILWQIQEAKKRQLPWLYLGYWVKGCQKMRYKTQYQPLEYFYSGQWLCDMDEKKTHTNKHSP